MKKLQIIILSILSLQVIHAFSQTDLMNVKPWAYWLQTIDIQTIVNDNSFELIVMDYSADGLDSQKWTTQQIDSVKNSGKYAISYISIGEAEDYRYYWNPSWLSNPPAWLGPENADWPGNYEVRYWYPEWHAIIYDYLDTILMQGFDGIYMDLIDNYYYWSVINPEQPYADSLMCQFVIDIRTYCDSVRGDNTFILLPQNGGDVWDQENVSASLKAAYFNAINGIGVEDVFFPGDMDEDNDYDPDTYRIGILQEYLLNNKQVYSIDYLTDPDKISQFINACIAENFVPYTCTRPLEYLCGGISVGFVEAGSNHSNDICLYPNPAGDYMNISFDQCDFKNISVIRIHNSKGQMVQEYTHNFGYSNVLTMDIAGFESGIYFLTVSDSALIKTFKFIISERE